MQNKLKKVYKKWGCFLGQFLAAFLAKNLVKKFVEFFKRFFDVSNVCIQPC